MHLTRDMLALGAAISEQVLPAAVCRLARLQLADLYEERGDGDIARLLRDDEGCVVPSGPERGRCGWEVRKFVPDPAGSLHGAGGGRYREEFLGLVDLTPGVPEWEDFREYE